MAVRDVVWLEKSYERPLPTGEDHAGYLFSMPMWEGRAVGIAAEINRTLQHGEDGAPAYVIPCGSMDLREKDKHQVVVKGRDAFRAAFPDAPVVDVGCLGDNRLAGFLNSQFSSRNSLGDSPSRGK